MEIIKFFWVVLFLSLYSCNKQDKSDRRTVFTSSGIEKKTGEKFELQEIISKREDGLNYRFRENTYQLIPSENSVFNLSVNDRIYNTGLLLESASVNVWDFKNKKRHIILIEGDDYYGSVFYAYLFENYRLYDYGSFNNQVKDPEKQTEPRTLDAAFDEGVINIRISRDRHNEDFRLKRNKEIPGFGHQQYAALKQSDFKIIRRITSDINQDGKNDEILVYETDWNKRMSPSDFKQYKIIIHLSDNNSFLTLMNDRIIEPYYPDNVATGFSDIKIRNPYFTVEQTNAGGGNMVSSYITFKYDTRKRGIYLHRYSEISSVQSSGDENEQRYDLTTQDFGNISFEKFDRMMMR